MNKYHHLSLEEKEKLYAWRESGLSLRHIAGRLNRSVATISRELKRHTRYGKPYLPCLAHRRAKVGPKTTLPGSTEEPQGVSLCTQAFKSPISLES